MKPWLVAGLLAGCNAPDDHGAVPPPVAPAEGKSPVDGEPPPTPAPKRDLASLGERIVERGRAVAEAASTSAVASLGPLVGGHVPNAPAKAGRYGSELDARQHRFVTMEHTITVSIDGGAVLSLLDDGTAEGCVWFVEHRRGSRSKYATRDGKPSTSESDRNQRVGLRGRWREDAGSHATVVTFDALEYRTCEVGPDVSPSASPIELRCWAVPRGGELPIDAAACRIESAWDVGEEVAMLLTESPRSGSWALREDLAHRDELDVPEDVRPWLLLGTMPGLKIRHDDHRARDPLKVELSTLPASTKLPPPAP